jgi:capsular polysaccharide transport system ATP-binding protein
MITLDGVSKVYDTKDGPCTVLQNINMQVARGEKIGILGSNGSGKSTLVRLIGGAEPPSEGRIHRGMSVSWPLAFTGGFAGNLTGLDNLRFICRVYGVDIDSAISFVKDFSELGSHLREPWKVYSSGMKTRLAFAISLAVDFDCYLIDEVTAVADARFREKCDHELFKRRHDRAVIMVSHSASNIQKHCERACVLNQGILHEFPDTKSAYAYYGTI